MAGPDVRKRPQERRLDAAMLRLEPLQQQLHLFALERVVAAGRAGAADHRTSDLSDEAHDLVLPDVTQRPDHDVLAVAGPEQRRHRADLSIEKLTHQKRLEEVVGVMTESDLVQPSSGAIR